MPLDELLALYGYEASDPISEHESEGSDTAANLPDMTLDKEQIAKDLLSGEEEEETQSSADDLTPSVTSQEASDLFPNQSAPRFLADADREPGSSTSSDTEEDPLPANKCKKEIMVGPQFQADLSNLHVNRHGEKSKWSLGRWGDRERKCRFHSCQEGSCVSSRVSSHVLRGSLRVLAHVRCMLALGSRLYSSPLLPSPGLLHLFSWCPHLNQVLSSRLPEFSV